MAKESNNTIDSDKIELLSRRLSEEVRDSVERDLKRRYAWMGIIVIVLTSGGLYLLVNYILSDAKVDLKSAQKIQESTTERITKALEKAETYKQKVVKTENIIEALQKKLSDIEDFAQKAEQVSIAAEEKLITVSSRAAALTKELSDQSTANLNISKTLFSDLGALTKVVDELLKTQSIEDVETDQFKKEIAAIKESISMAELTISKQTSRAELARYPIKVASFSNQDKMINHLQESGFSVSGRPKRDDYTPSKQINRTIFLDPAIPSDIAFEIVVKAREIWPFLNLICTVGDLGQPVFIGGHQSVEKNYRCLDITNRSFKSVEEFENLITSIR